jgi:hypothetical protein
MYILLPNIMNPMYIDSSVGIELGYGLDDRDSRVRLPAGAGNSSLHHRVQNGSGAHPAIQWVPGALSLGIKRPGREADHSPPSSTGVKNAWSYTSTPQYVFIEWYLVKQLYIYLYVHLAPGYRNFSTYSRHSGDLLADYHSHPL